MHWPRDHDGDGNIQERLQQRTTRSEEKPTTSKANAITLATAKRTGENLSSQTQEADPFKGCTIKLIREICPARDRAVTRETTTRAASIRGYGHTELGSTRIRLAVTKKNECRKTNTYAQLCLEQKACGTIALLPCEQSYCASASRPPRVM